MTSTITELVIDFSDLSQLSISCPKCLTRVVLDCNDQEARIPDRCPSCSEDYEDGLRQSLRAFRDVYRKLSGAEGRKVQIRLKQLAAPERPS